MDNINLRLWEAFSDIYFEEETHKYTNSLGTKFKSVTGWIGNFHEHFDSDGVAEKCAAKRGIAKEDLLFEWKQKGDYSCALGTATHACIENLWYRKKFTPNFTEKFLIEKNILADYSIRAEKCKKAFELLSKRFVPVKNEYIVYDVLSLLCGTIDFLAYDTKNKNYAILDWKTNGSIDTVPNGFTKKMFAPFDNLWDLNFGHYSLLLSTYKAILLKHIPEIEISNLILVHIPGEDKPIKSYKCEDVSKIVRERFLEKLNESKEAENIRRG